MQVNIAQGTTHRGLYHEANRTCALLLGGHTGLETLGALEVKLRVEHISRPGDSAAAGDIKVLLRNQRRRVAQVTARDDIRARQVVTASKVNRILESSATVDSGAVLAIFRQEDVDLGTFVNLDVGLDVGSAAATCGHQDGLFARRVVKVGEGNHILIDSGRELRDVIFHDIGDVRAIEQCGVGSHTHDIAVALNSCIDIGQALTEELGIFILIAVHELHLTALGTQVYRHVVHVAQVNGAVDNHGAAVGARQPVIVEGDDVVLDGDAVIGELERTAISRQVECGRVSDKVSVDTRVVQRARDVHITHSITVKPDVVAGDEGIGTNQRETVELCRHVERRIGIGIVERALDHKRLLAVKNQVGGQASGRRGRVEVEVGIQGHVALVLAVVIEVLDVDGTVTVGICAVPVHVDIGVKGTAGASQHGHDAGPLLKPQVVDIEQDVLGAVAGYSGGEQFQAAAVALEMQVGIDHA